jgi:type VI secretion system protein ImpL
LTEVVIAESGLVESDPRARARRRFAITAGLAAIAALVLLTLIFWAVSFSGNRALQSRLQLGAQNVQSEIRAVGVDLVEARSTDPDLEQSVAILRALRELPGGYADQHKGGRPILMTFGLYQSGHAQEAKQAYLGALQRIMLPRILLRLEAYINEQKADPLKIYDALKVYLMLGGQGPFDARAVKSWVEADWAETVFPGSDREELRKELGDHLDALVENGQPSAVWPDRQAPLDGALIATARQTIQSLSLADRAYAILRQKADGAGSPWRASDVLASGDGRAFAAGDAILRLSVPYFFTKEGYRKAYLLGLQTVQADLAADAWVLGPDAATVAVRSQMSDLGPGVAADYAKDYIAAWEGLVSALKPADYFHDPVAFGVFTRTPSPLKVLLLEVRKNTTFGDSAGGPANPLAAPLAKLTKLAGSVGAGVSGGGDAGQRISDYFKPLDDYVGDGKGPGPIDDFVSSVKNAGAASAGAAVAGGGLGGAALQGQLATAIGGLAAASAGAPPMLQGFIATAVEGGKTAQTSSAKGAVADAYRQDLAPICQATVEDRYPFNEAAQSDAAVTDMLRLFGQGGAFEAFTRDRLGTLLDRVGPVWRWNIADPVGAQLDPLAAEAFHKADEIHDLLTAGLSPQVEGAGFGGAVTAVEISSGGTTWRFEANTLGAKPLMWSLNSGLPEAHVTLFGGSKEVKTFSGHGPWALFRLMDQARQENAGPTAFKATFGEGASFATLKFTLESDRNPFRRGSLWSFRCPASL